MLEVEPLQMLAGVARLVAWTVGEETETVTGLPTTKAEQPAEVACTVKVVEAEMAEDVRVRSPPVPSMAAPLATPFTNNW